MIDASSLNQALLVKDLSSAHEATTRAVMETAYWATRRAVRVGLMVERCWMGVEWSWCFSASVWMDEWDIADDCYSIWYWRDMRG